MITWNPKDYASNSTQQQKWARELIAKLHLRGDERVLDIGCGDGKVSAEIADQLPGGSVVGLDSSPAMIDFARNAFPQMSSPNLTFIEGDASAVNFAAEFDVVFSNACLHWICDHRPVLAGVARSLRPGGRVLLQMGGAGNAAALLRTFTEMIASDAWREHFVDFTFRYGFHAPEEYRVWLSEAGLRPKRVELIHKRAQQVGAAGLAGWIRTTWMPYIQCVPESQRSRFVGEVVNRYLEQNPLTGDGMATAEMRRLEVEAELR